MSAGWCVSKFGRCRHRALYIVLQFVANHCHLDGWLDDVVPPPPVAFWRDARTVTPLDECVISVPALLRGCSDSTAS